MQQVTLEALLRAREERALLQKQLLAQYPGTLICFTMNIPGPTKCSQLILRGFRLGMARLEAQLAGANLQILHTQYHTPYTGCEAYYIVAAPAEMLKRMCVEIEDAEPVGRLFDMDVIDRQGRKAERTLLGAPRRKCLLCQEDAAVCGRSRRHSVEQLQAETHRLLTQALVEEDCRTIANIAQKSLLYEVCITPKPGLVDRENNGSHRDMDIFTFLDSASSLWPYFHQCVQIGRNTAALPAAETLAQLRYPGKLAQYRMLQCTSGVNTHKGAIFSLGILCAAAGRLEPEQRTEAAILAQCAAMTAGLTQELTQLSTPQTVGEQLYKRYGISGIRGQAEAGFPAVLHTGLPVLRAGLAQGLSINDAGCAALLHLIAAAEDTCLISRSNLEIRNRIASELSQLLAKTPYPSPEVLRRLDQDFVKQNLSPGGCADLLALTLFLHFLSSPENRITD